MITTCALALSLGAVASAPAAALLPVVVDDPRLSVSELESALVSALREAHRGPVVLPVDARRKRPGPDAPCEDRDCAATWGAALGARLVISVRVTRADKDAWTVDVRRIDAATGGIERESGAARGNAAAVLDAATSLLRALLGGASVPGALSPAHAPRQGDRADDLPEPPRPSVPARERAAASPRTLADPTGELGALREQLTRVWPRATTPHGYDHAVRLAEQLRRLGESRPPLDATEQDALAISCDAGDVGACQRLGVARLWDPVGLSDLRAAGPRFRQACRGGQEEACLLERAVIAVLLSARAGGATSGASLRDEQAGGYLLTAMCLEGIADACPFVADHGAGGKELLVEQCLENERELACVLLVERGAQWEVSKTQRTAGLIVLGIGLTGTAIMGYISVYTLALVSAFGAPTDDATWAIVGVVLGALGVALGVSGLGLGLYLDGRRDVTALEERAAEMRRNLYHAPADGP